MKKVVKKVIVAMSGGVDSSVAAAMLKKQGDDVVGVFMRFWKPQNHAEQNAELRGREENLCCSTQAEAAARAVARKLKIPFRVLNLSREFKKEVVDYFLSEQAKGRTPNPCVVCNKKIKFGLLFQYARKIKADFLASGHYAKIVKRETYKIFAARDKQKDQSYFLWGLNQKKLAKIIFPLERMEKDEVRNLARKWRLPYHQAESFDLCFAPEGGENFIKKYLKLKTGPIKNLEGKFLGRHQGLALYTIGQRKRLDFPQARPPMRQGPWRVVKKDEKSNTIFVSNQGKDLFFQELILEKINWLADRASKLPLKAWIKIRYKSEAAEAEINQQSTISNQQLKIQFQKPQFAPTPGQSAVFYTKRGEMLGGGIIKSVFSC